MKQLVRRIPKRKSKSVVKKKLSLMDAVKELSAVSNKLNAQVNGIRLVMNKILQRLPE